jgi:hypothetical protein
VILVKVLYKCTRLFLTNAFAVGTDLSVTVYLCHKLMCKCHILPYIELLVHFQPTLSARVLIILGSLIVAVPYIDVDWIQLAYVLHPV